MSSQRKATSRGETSQLRRVGSIAWETDRLPLPRHLYPLALLHLHLHEGPSCLLLARCRRCLRGGLLGRARRRGGARKQGIQHFHVSQLPTQQPYSLNAGIIPSSPSTVTVGGGAEKRKTEEGRDTQAKAGPCWHSTAMSPRRKPT